MALLECGVAETSINNDQDIRTPNSDSPETFDGGVRKDMTKQHESCERYIQFSSTPSSSCDPCAAPIDGFKVLPIRSSKMHHFAFSDEYYSHLPMNTPTSVAWEIHISDAKNPQRFRRNHNVTWDAGTSKSQSRKPLRNDVSTKADEVLSRKSRNDESSPMHKISVGIVQRTNDLTRN